MYRYRHVQLGGARASAYFHQLIFYLFTEQKNTKDLRGDVSRNMRVKFEVRSFDNFEAIRI